MTGLAASAAPRRRRTFRTAIAAGFVVLPLLAAPAFARGPGEISEVAESSIDAVVNISTSQKVNTPQQPQQRSTPQPPQGSPPQGSPFEEFFEEFFRRRGQER